MYIDLFNDFLSSGNTFQVYEDGKLVFSSDKDRLLPLLEYLDSFSPRPGKVAVFDKIVGNAAAVLLVIAGCREVYSPLGSHLAIKTLDKFGINYHFSETVPYIQQANKIDMCPMEKLSLDKTPEEFHEIMKNLIKQ
ncbi:DUF1893 domain-containing protein [Chloroflexota bacterium]